MTIRTTSSILKGDPTIEYIEGLTLTENITDISSWFVGCSKLKEDFIFPAHITNCMNTFKDCASLLYIHSNWKNTYTNGITTTDCYAGCINITHCDDIDLGVNEYINGLDEIPIAWGGYGFTSELTGIYVFEIPSNNYTLTLETRWNKNGLIGEGVVAWGDGVSTTRVTSHTYATAGRYVVKMHGYTSDNAYCHDSICECLVEVVKMPYRDYNIGYLFNNCSKLKKLNMSNITGQLSYWLINCTSLTEVIAYNVTLRGDNGVFQNCPYLERIEGLNTWDTSQVTSMRNFFNWCSSLTEIDVSSFDTSNVTDMEGMFRNFGLGVSTSKLKRIKGIENFNTSKVKNMKMMFQGQNLLTELNTTGWNLSGITDMSNAFNSCTSLKTIIGHENWDLSSTSNMGLCFYMCSSLESLDVTNWNCGYGVNGVFQGSGLKKIIGIENLVNSRWTNMESLFRDCPLEELNISNWDTSNVIYFGHAFTGNKFTEVVGLENLNMDSCSYADYMFANCTNLTDLSKGVFKSNSEFSADTGQGLINAFSGCTSLKKIGRVINKGSWKACFNGCTSLESIEEINTSTNYATTYLIFSGCSSLTSVNFTGTGYRHLTGANNNSTWHYPDFDHDSMLSLFNWLNPNGPTNYGTSSSPLK